MKEIMNRFMKKKRSRKLVAGAGVFLVLAVFLGWSLSGKGTEAWQGLIDYVNSRKKSGSMVSGSPF
jgi:type II secretory pathway component PulM